MLFRPFVRTADHCAKRRNHYWQHIRKTDLDTGIDIPSDVHPYPKKSDRISDKAANDSGGNFGRLSVTELWMTTFGQCYPKMYEELPLKNGLISSSSTQRSNDE